MKLAKTIMDSAQQLYPVIEKRSVYRKFETTLVRALVLGYPILDYKKLVDNMVKNHRVFESFSKLSDMKKHIEELYNEGQDKFTRIYP